jgi:hypothetical protein
MPLYPGPGLLDLEGWVKVIVVLRGAGFKSYPKR